MHKLKVVGLEYVVPCVFVVGLHVLLCLLPSCSHYFLPSHSSLFSVSIYQLSQFLSVQGVGGLTVFVYISGRKSKHLLLSLLKNNIVKGDDVSVYWDDVSAGILWGYCGCTGMLWVYWDAGVYWDAVRCTGML